MSAMDPDLTIPQELYNSEINFSITTLWDNGFEVTIGLGPDFLEVVNMPTYLEACTWLRRAALRHYPRSAFARKHGHGLRLVSDGVEKANVL